MISPFRKPLLAMTAIALALLPACAQPASSKAEIEKIIEEYIVANPEIIERAFVALQEKEALAKSEAAKAAIAANVDKLYGEKSDYSIGPANAKVTVVEFFDYRCGWCKKSVETVRGLPKKYDGQVRVVFKEFPLFDGISTTAALAALAAGKQGKYVEMHIALMELESNDDLTEAKIDELAKAVGVNVARMRADMKSTAVIDQLAESQALARALLIGGTPGFFIGEEHIEGADFKSIEAAIEAELKS
jgi:protein-disulfide isomerase